ncbi:hypothetical protein CR513_37389, partial [Mucuna pruriens]
MNVFSCDMQYNICKKLKDVFDDHICNLTCIAQVKKGYIKEDRTKHILSKKISFMIFKMNNDVNIQ